MDTDRTLDGFAYGLMKLGLIVFLFPFFWQFVTNPGLESPGGNTSISILLTVVYIILVFIIVVMSKENFDIFGFSVVLLASIAMLCYIWIKMGWHDGMAPYFLLICISVYFLLKVNRSY